MLLTTTEQIPNQTYEILGIALGRCHVDMADMLDTPDYDEATDDLSKGAEAVFADAVVNLRYITTPLGRNAAEVLVYGTAVKFK